MLSCSILSAIFFIAAFVHVLTPDFFPILGRKVLNGVVLVWRRVKKASINFSEWIVSKVHPKPPPHDLENQWLKAQPPPTAPMAEHTDNNCNDDDTPPEPTTADASEDSEMVVDEDLKHLAQQFA